MAKKSTYKDGQFLPDSPLANQTDLRENPQANPEANPQVNQMEALGQSETFLEFQEQLSRVSQVNRPVLLIGERGTGKELAASRLHYLSARWQGPFVTLNCAALSPALIEAELFGHEEGAFTGATRRRLGRFETANGGSLFLDEIGQIPIEAQEKILRAVEYGSFERVGSSQPISVYVQIIGATNADLKALAVQGRFKSDLLDRLSFEVLFLPPLRERREDIFLLANHFAARMAFELGKDSVPRFSAQALTTLDQYPWPGNIRELKNVVERAVYRADSATISDSDIVTDPFQSPFRLSTPNMLDSLHQTAIKEGPGEREPGVSLPPADQAFVESVQDFECLLLERALKRTRYNQRKTAEQLGLTYHQFRGLYRKYAQRLQLET